MTRQSYSIEEIKDMLLAQIDSVAHHYAPPAPGSHTTHGQYFTLNPGRADNNVGSFFIYMSGPKQGRWCDFAMAPRPGSGTNCATGDVFDLIGLAIGKDKMPDQLREARTFLGLETESPETRRARERAAAEARRRREAAARDEASKKEARARMAQRLWLEAGEGLRGTPVDHYLREARGIDLSRLGRAPRVLRFHPACYYKHIDQETGEVIEGRYPAMVAAVSDHRGQHVATHRTYLGQRNGQWGKADLPKAKKVIGDYAGASINLWRGIGPRGGKPASLNQCPPGTHVYIAEGIEDALSAVLLNPELRVICAISLSNMGGLRLPRNVMRVTLLADLDENDSARAALAHAVARHRKAGREVRLWQNRLGGKDLNDALRLALQEGEE